MRTIGMHKQFKPLYRFLFGYLFVFLIPLLVTLYVYSDLYQSTLKLAYNEQLSFTEKSGALLDSYFAATENLSYQLNTNYYVQQYLQAEDPTMDPTMVSDIYRLNQTITPYLVTNNFIKEVQIYSQKSQSMVSNGKAYLNLQNIYNERYKAIYKDFDTWRQDYLDKEYNPEYIYHSSNVSGAGEQGYITYAKSVKRVSEQSISNIFIRLDSTSILAPFESMSGIETGFSLIYDGYANYISNKTLPLEIVNSIYEKCEGVRGHFTETINEENMLITFSEAKTSSRYYITAVSEEFVLQGLKNVKLLFAIVMLLTVVVGVLFIVRLAYKNSRPIMGLIDILDKNKMLESVDYSEKFINQEVLSLIQNNHSLMQKAANQIPSMKIALLYKLLNGSGGSVEGLIEDFEQLDINLDGNFFAILIMSINDLNSSSKIGEISTYHAIVNEKVSATILGVIGIYDIDLEKTAILISSKASNYVDLVSELEHDIPKIKRYAQNEMGIQISFSGSITNSIQTVFKCYYEAKTALNYNENINNMEILWFNKAKKSGEQFFSYTIQTETELINYISNGNIELCDKLLQDIYKSNFKNSSINKALLLQLLHSLTATLVRCVAQSSNISDELKECVEKLPLSISSCKSENDGFEQIAETARSICSSNHTITKRRSTIDDIVSHVSSNYSDNQLSLSSVAQLFGITEIYLSRFFKEKTGENFSKYIENLRMQKAKQLLSENKYTIKAISEMVGYNSPQGFRRVYKKYFEELPSKRD